MRKAFVLSCFVGFVAVQLVAHGAPGERHSHRGRGLSSSTNRNGEPLTQCSQIEFKYDGKPAARAEESLPVASLRSLSVRGSDRTAMFVSPSTDGTYAVTACKAAARPELLAQVRATLSGNEVSTTGPDANDWSMYLLVRAPRSADLTLQNESGPVAIEGVGGKILAQVSNGPISVKNTSGSVTVESSNGPVSFSGASGDVRLSATNGPVSVKLTGDSWAGSLDARTQNGPLSLRVPETYRSAILVETNGHGPVSCRASACAGARQQMNEDGHWPRRIEFGSGTPMVKLTANNGPVTVKN
ncbi:MAG TPA: hypothetical protein VFL80_10715 [Thermoanaerobaculia bacterium]|nr:hypothetical protein [Thermoanaerobaculia bacterium]